MAFHVDPNAAICQYQFKKGFCNAVLLFSSILYILDGTYGITVRQEPHNLQVSEGASVNMTCNFSIQREYNSTVTANVNWFRIDVNRSKVYSDRLNICGSSSLQLHSMRLNDSGVYICEVNVITPLLLNGNGTGTRILVTAIRSGGPMEAFPNFPAVGNLAAVGVSLFGLLVIIVVIATIFKKRRGNSQVSVNRAENDQQAEVSEVTYASINNQKSHSSKNQQRMEDKKQGQDSTNEEQVLYSAIRIKHPD
ncbi:uncharacterized protein LOC116221025 isoform X2 [Clupea harengus]|uniref:Uncharacterized protein LOC116221025 isoform X2 n=1 Tax=Clupea harengus TaxID=7950 RepID=A0A6P8FQW8_CLUHA|nr:uncharacterized protein LOC116221025 isoform X2 [Clupea harengus]